MQSIANQLGSLAIVSIATLGCAASHIGSWEHSDGRVYRRLMLSENGTCILVAGSTIGRLRDGIGARCNYSRVGDIISITSMGEINGTGPMEALPQPMQLRVESGHLTALDGERETLVRVPK